MSFTHHHLIAAAGGEDEARPWFERMVTACVRLQHPTVRNLRAAPGDWGIDAVVGELDGRVAIWQAKFFPDEVSDTQQGQIRGSFNQAMKKASEEGYKVDFWTLCIPIQMSPEEAKWFDGWRGRSQRKHPGLTITVPWDRDKLSSLIYSPEGAAVRAEFLGISVPEPLRDVFDVPDDRTFDEMLFIKQLRAAGLIDMTASKREFFNAEVLTREVQEKGVATELAELVGERLDVHSVWSTAFNGACAGAVTETRELPGLYETVFRELRTTLRTPPPLGMRAIHRLGTMHQVVDDGEAGWRRDYPEIAKEHRGDS